MSNTDLTVIHYLRLAAISRGKQQRAGCDRFLILAGAAACPAGWLDVAEVCRQRVLEDNPHHMLGRWESLPDALRSEDFKLFLRQLERVCSPERAESLLNELGETLSITNDAGSAKDQALEQLADPVWET